MTTMTRSLWTTAVVLLGLGGAGSGASAQDAPDLTGMSLDQLLDAEVVYAASRRIQTLREAPSAVSVVTAADIRAHGYRTIAEVLRSLPSFYVTEDRRYSFVGVRGFNRPGDYGARILLLLNGLRTNDALYEQAYVGQDFIIDIDLVERIEVVRGPSAAIYGSSAFFAVVNVVTRRGRDFQGGELSAAASSFETHSGRATYGRRLDSGLELLVSASLSGSRGQRLYFKEYDDPGTANGIADRIDGENFDRLLASLSKGDFTFEANHVSRDKGIPTGVYGSLFGDARTRSTDAKDLVSLTYARSRPNRSSVMARVHYGRLDAHGTYAITDAPTGVTLDSGRGQWYGLEGSVVRPLGARHLLTAGVEFQDDFSLRQLNLDQAPRVVNQDSQNEAERAAVFAQDEITLSKRLTFHVGIRQDWYQSIGQQTSPRLALVFDDSKATTLKLLAGRAFRAPDEFELHFEAPPYKLNPGLGPETIYTDGTRPGTGSSARPPLERVHVPQRGPRPDLAELRPRGRPSRLPEPRPWRFRRGRDRPRPEARRGSVRSPELCVATQPGSAFRRAPHELPAPHGQGGHGLAAAGQAPHGWHRWLVPLLAHHAGGGAVGFGDDSQLHAAGSADCRAVRAHGQRLQPLRPGLRRSGAPEVRQDLLIQDGRNCRLKVGFRF